jgi:hypothetical protein
MKTPVRLLAVSLFLVSIFILPSCKKAVLNETGSAEFSLASPVAIGQLKSASTDSVASSYQLLISAVDVNGKEVLSNKLIPLYTFGTGFLSEKVQIPAGEFKLTKFMIINASGAVVYATPLSGSPLAYLTTRPLPLKFNIYTGQVTTIAPEVLSVGNLDPSQFGYATFGIQVIKPLDLYTSCVLSYDNTTTPTVITTAKLSVSNNAGWTYSFALAASVNHLVIRGGSEKYTFVLGKDGYATQTLTFTAAQLTATTSTNPLILKIPAGSVSTTQVMYFQPGPDDGKDATISDIQPTVNFGTYKYFEATYMTEGLLTVMQSKRSLIFFNMSALPKSAVIKKAVLKLFYDTPIPWDSTIFVASSSALIKPYGVFQQIVEGWDENAVTWNNQPKTTEVNQVYLYPFIRNVNYVEVDITGLIVIPAANALPNNGIMFKLSKNEKFKGFRFCSSDYPDATMRPKLAVQYTVN